MPRPFGQQDIDAINICLSCQAPTCQPWSVTECAYNIRYGKHSYNHGTLIQHTAGMPERHDTPLNCVAINKHLNRVIKKMRSQGKYIPTLQTPWKNPRSEA